MNIINTKVNIKNYFNLEKKRDYFARKNNMKLFKQTYKERVQIPNKNNVAFWNKLTNNNQITLDGSPIYRDKIDKVIKTLNKDGGKILDIGFGHGAIEKKLQNTNYEIFGTEISKNLVERVRKMLRGTYRIGYISKLPFKNNQFDYVLALDVIEHLPPNQALVSFREISRVMHTNSKFIVSVPLNEGLENMVYKNKNPNGHLRAYTFEILKTELVLSGFIITKVFNLYAFRKLYHLKSFLLNLVPFAIKKPNLLIIIAQKK